MTDYVDCDHCGARYDRTYSSFGMRDRDSASCDICDYTLEQWDSSSVPSFRLVLDPRETQEPDAFTVTQEFFCDGVPLKVIAIKSNGSWIISCWEHARRVSPHEITISGDDDEDAEAAEISSELIFSIMNAVRVDTLAIRRAKKKAEALERLKSQ